MAPTRTEISGRQIKNYSVQRQDLDVTTVGQSVITKVLAGSGISISSTGGDAGTGDVTITSSGAAFQANDSWLQWRNAADTGYLDGIKVDTSGSLVLNTDVSNGQIVLQRQKNNVLSFTDTALKFFATDFVIKGNSSDNADNQSLTITPANASTAYSTRGASIQMFGNEHASVPGSLILQSGAVENSYLRLQAGGSTGKIEFVVNQDVKWNLDSSGHLNGDPVFGGHVRFYRDGYGVRSNGVDLTVGSETAHSFLLATNSQTRMTITSTGDVAVASSVTENSQMQVTSLSTTKKGLVVKAAASQTANIFEVQNNSGTPLLAVEAGGAISLNNQLIKNVATPVSSSDAATKGYIDSIVFPMDVKGSCRVATTANITLSGTQTIDGVSVVAGDRVLVKNQTTGSQNGIYVVAAGSWSRASDADTNSEVTANLFVFVSEGTTQADTQWVLTTNDPITLGTTALTFAQFGQAAGSGISTLNTLSTATQSFATSTSGTDFAISSSGSTHTFTLPDASVTARGLVTTGEQTFTGRKLFSSGVRPAGNVNFYRFYGSVYPSIGTNGTNFNKVVEIDGTDAPINAGVTDSGYRVALNLESYLNKPAFQGTLAENIGLWARAGSDTSDPTGTINYVYAVKAQVLKGTNVTHTNAFGFYEYSADPDSKNYMQSPLGLNVLSPGAQFHVNLPSASTKGLIVQGAASQTANLLEAQNSSGAVLAAINSSGAVLTNTIGNNGSSALTLGTTTSHALTLRTNSLSRWSLTTGGDLSQDATNGGDLVFNKAGSDVVSKVATAVSAAGTTQGAATAITATRVEVTTATGGSADSVVLPVPVAGKTYVIFNRSSATINVFPSSGCSINSLSANTALTVASSSSVSLTAISSTKWYSEASASSTVAALDDLTDVVITSPSTNQVLSFNGTNWVNSAAGSSGITSLNTLSTTSQTFAKGTAGTDFDITSSGSTHTFNIPDASATARGLVTITDQTFAGIKTFSGTVGIANGSAASPSLFFTNDTNTGLFRESADKIVFVANGQNAAGIDGTSGVGRLIVGNGTPISRIHIADDGGTATSGITFGTNTSTDVQLYRSGSTTLTCDGTLSLNNNLITNVATPVSANDVATKAYVDAITFPMDVKNSCRVATTANITLSGTQTIDGIAVVAGDRVLVKDQTTGSQNGIYVVASGAWARSTDADTSAEVTANMFVFVSEGSTQADTQWVLTTNDTITLGTTALTFAQFGAAAGSGIRTLNNLSTTSQTFAKGTLGTDFDITSSGSIHTFNLPTASATNRGALASADWTTFNNKLGSLNNLTGATQTFAKSSTGTDFDITSSGTVHTFIIPSASATARGLVTTAAQTIAGVKTFSSGISIGADSNLGGFKLTNLGTPTANSDAATKAYVDSLAGGQSSSTVQTTNATTTTLYTLAMADNTTYKLSADIAGRLSSTTAKGIWAKIECGGYRNNAGSATLAGDPLYIVDTYGSSGYQVSVSVSGNNLLISVTGAASETVNWIGNVKVVSVS